MVGVVVVDLDVPRFPTPLEATGSSAKLCELGCSVLARHPPELQRRPSGGSGASGVQPRPGGRPGGGRPILTPPRPGDVRGPPAGEALHLGSPTQSPVVGA